MSRVEQLTDKGQLPTDQRPEIDALIETLGSVPPPFTVLLHSPGTATKVMEAGKHIRLNSVLSPKERQLAIAAVARHLNCETEWATHINNAKKAGISDASMEAIRTRRGVSSLPADEHDIVQYVWRLLGTTRVDEDLFSRLLEKHSVRWMVDLTATIGQYLYVGAILNAFELIPDGEPVL